MVHEIVRIKLLLLVPMDTGGLGAKVSFPEKDERVSEDISQAKIPGTARWTERMEELHCDSDALDCSKVPSTEALVRKYTVNK